MITLFCKRWFSRFELGSIIIRQKELLIIDLKMFGHQSRWMQKIKLPTAMTASYVKHCHWWYHSYLCHHDDDHAFIYTRYSTNRIHQVMAKRISHLGVFCESLFLRPSSLNRVSGHDKWMILGISAILKKSKKSQKNIFFSKF